MSFKWIPVLLLSIFLASCASNPEQEGSAAEAARHAAQVNTQLGREYMNRGQYEVALEKLKKAINSDKNYAPAHTMIAVFYEQIGEQDLVEKHYREAVKISPENGDVNNNYGSYLCRSGQAKSAEKYFLTAVDDPFYRTPAVALSNAGSCQLEMGNLDKAESYLRQSLEYDPKFPDALLEMAGISYQRGNHLGARAFLQRYEDAGPRTAESLMMGYRVETHFNNSVAARRYADLVLNFFPGSYQATEIKSLRQQ